MTGSWLNYHTQPMERYGKQHRPQHRCQARYRDPSDVGRSLPLSKLYVESSDWWTRMPSFYEIAILYRDSGIKFHKMPPQRQAQETGTPPHLKSCAFQCNHSCQVDPCWSPMILDLGIFVASKGIWCHASHGGKDMFEEEDGKWQLWFVSMLQIGHVRLNRHNLKARLTLHEVSIHESEYSAPQNLKLTVTNYPNIIQV